MTRKKAGLAEALLKAHVKHIADRLHGDALEHYVAAHLDALLADAAKLKLEEFVTRQMIKDTAKAYAVDLQIAGSVPELVGDIARALYSHNIHRHTRLADVVPNAAVYEVTDIVLGLRTLRERLLREVTASPLYRSFASELLYHGITGYLSQNAVTKRIPGADSMIKFGKSMLSKATPGLEASIEEGLRRYIERSVAATAEHSADFLIHALSDEPLRELVLEAWAKLKDIKLDRLREDIGTRDIEELFVAGYEYWLTLRRTPYYQTMIDTGIDIVFDKYGDTTLVELLEEFGITRRIMLDEAMRYAHHVLPVLRKRKLLEPMIRRLLEDFYSSEAFAEVLAAH